MAVEVCIVSVEEPPVVIDAGLKPPLVIPVRKTVLAANAQIYRTRKATHRRDGNSVCSRSSGDYFLCSWTNGDVKVRAGGKYFIVRVGGFGSELPVASITVSETVYVPGVLNVTLPGFCAVDVAGAPPGKTQE